jgi:hydroxymethylglutaryl-CoA reductase
MKKEILGFSKLSKDEKIRWITESFFKDPDKAKLELSNYWNSNQKIQKKHDEFIENTLTNFYMPLGVAPNFVINNKSITIPMVIEESSVVAAASKSAKYWSKRGGFHAEVLGVEKIGHVHFFYKGEKKKLHDFFDQNKNIFFKSCDEITSNMKIRGGGILSIDLKDKSDLLKNYFQIDIRFNTVDSMGANFINSCLEQIAKSIKSLSSKSNLINENNIDIVMSILSNYVPNCLVKTWVNCPVDELNENTDLSPNEFAKRFIQAVKISEVDPYRAVTHNKGIMNGIDSLALATGNDFRAIEAGVHAYASRNGRYSGLTKASVKDDIFTLEMTIPLSIGTVGGLTSLHPLVKWSLELLNNPNSEELMKIIGVAGLAQNFAAIRSLVTSGIQKGHMKMHLLNILNQMKVKEKVKVKAIEYFKKNTVSHKEVEKFLKTL